jgi:hypothetical protein
MKKYDNPDDELGEISPFLRQLKNQASHHSDNIPKNYFADFENKLMQKIYNPTVEKPIFEIKKLSFSQTIRPFRWLAAASVVFIFAIFGFFYKNYQYQNTELADYEAILKTISKDDIKNYLLEHPEELDLNWLALDEKQADNFYLLSDEIEEINDDLELKQELLKDLEESDFYE